MRILRDALVLFELENEPRRHERLPATGSILLQLESDTILAELVDFAAGGIGIVCAYPLQVGSSIQVRRPNGVTLSRVVYCYQDGDKFRAGIEFIDSGGR